MAELVADLGMYAKAPPGAFVDVVPAESTTIRLSASKLSVSLLPRKLPLTAILQLQDCGISTLLERDSVNTKVETTLSDVQLLLKDGLEEVGTHFNRSGEQLC